MAKNRTRIDYVGVPYTWKKAVKNSAVLSDFNTGSTASDHRFVIAQIAGVRHSASTANPNPRFDKRWLTSRQQSDLADNLSSLVSLPVPPPFVFIPTVTSSLDRLYHEK